MAEIHTGSVCYYNFQCVYVFVCLCLCASVCVHMTRSQANICPPQHSWDVMSPAFNRDNLLSTHSLPTDGQLLSTNQPALQHTHTHTHNYTVTIRTTVTGQADTSASISLFADISVYKSMPTYFGTEITEYVFFLTVSLLLSVCKRALIMF